MACARGRNLFPINIFSSHALTHEVAYNSVLAERRRAIHEQTARAVEALCVPHLDDHYSGLAHHYTQRSR